MAPLAVMVVVKRRILLWGCAALVALIGYGGYMAWRAHRNLVSLEVRDMPVRDVVAKLERQTWEKIIVHKDVQAKITLQVNDATLEDVLNIISEQAEARWTALYPLYTKADRLTDFTKIARGDMPVEGSSWTNLQVRFGGFGGRGGPGGPGPGGFADMVRGQSKFINLELANRDLPFATMALARFSQAQVVPENGTAGNLNLHLKQVPYQKAVAAVAGQVNRKWEQFYALQPGFGRDFGRNDRGGPDRGDRRGRDGERGTNRFDPDVMEQRREEFAARREQQFEAQLATMTPDEQAKAKEERKTFEDMRNLSPEERAQKFQEMASRPEFQQRMQQRMMGGIMNTTPEQRVERAQRRLEREKRRQQQNAR